MTSPLAIHGLKPNPTCRIRMPQVNWTALPCGAMSEADVCAVIYSQAPDPRVQSAVGAQTRAPSSVLGGPTTLAEAVRSTRSANADWLWLLDGHAVPELEALAAMLDAAQAAATPAPVLLSSKVVGRDGRLHPDSTPRHEILVTEQSVHAAEHHLVKLRAAAPGDRKSVV